MKKKLSACIVLLVCLLSGCVTAGKEQFRGVAPHVWQKLTLEQKTLIIDSTLRDELGVVGALQDES